MIATKLMMTPRAAWDRDQSRPEMAGTAVTVCNLQGRLLSAAPAFYALTGYTAPELVGRTLSRLQGPGTDPASIEMFRHLIGRCEAGIVEILNYRKSGEPFWMRCHIRPIATPSGSPHLFVATHEDAANVR